MSIEAWLAFVAAALVVLVIPGPTILTVISYALAHGRRARLPAVAGVTLGDSTALLLSLVGLGGVLATSATLFLVVKLAGGAYLVFLGVRMLRSGVALPVDDGAAVPASARRMFAQTYVVTALNPKGIIFFVAFVPQFLDPARPLPPQLALLAVTFVVLATINATLYAAFAQAARRLMASARAQRRFNVAGGLLLVGAGAWAMLARRQA